MGVYLAGYILETTNSWVAVFQITAAINMFGCLVFLMFGSGNAIVWICNTLLHLMKHGKVCMICKLRIGWNSFVNIIKKLTILAKTFCRQRNVTVLNLNYCYSSHLIHSVFQMEIWHTNGFCFLRKRYNYWILEFRAKIM